MRADVHDAVDAGFDLDLIFCEELMSARNILMDDPEVSLSMLGTHEGGDAGGPDGDEADCE